MPGTPGVQLLDLWPLRRQHRSRPAAHASHAEVWRAIDGTREQIWERLYLVADLSATQAERISTG